MSKLKQSKWFIYFLITLMLLPNLSPLTVYAETSDVILHHDFETDTDGWEALDWGNSTSSLTRELTEIEAFSGQKSLEVSREAYNSKLSLNLTDQLIEGESYKFSFSIKLKEGTETLRLASKHSYPGTTNEYPWVIGNKEVSTEWVTFESEAIHYEPGTTEFIVYIESNQEVGTPAVYYLDDIQMIQLEGEDTPEEPEGEAVSIIKHDFETETHGWEKLSWGEELTTALTTAEAYTGDQSLEVTRTGFGSKLSLNLTDQLTEGETYKLSFHLKLKEGTEQLRLASKYSYPETSNEYPWIINTKEVGTEWVRFESGEINYMPGTTEFIVYLESEQTEGTPSVYYLDDVEVVHLEKETTDDKPAAETLSLIDFESGDASGFVARGEVEELTVTDETNHTPDGTMSLKVENRSQNWHGPSLDVYNYVDQGELYEVSAWVKMVEGSDELKLSTQVGAGDTASYNNITSAQVTANEWVNLKGTYRYSSLGGGNLSIYVEGASATSSFYLDDVTFTKLESAPIVIEDITPIKDVYQDDFLIGNAVSMSEFEGVRLELLKKHFNLVSAENAMKPSYAYDEEGNFNFDAEKLLVETAIEEGFDIHGHVLVWHQQSRDALYQDEAGNPLSREEALENMYTHIETTMAAFKDYDDHLISWDVVNEAMIDSANAPYDDWESNLRQSGWYKAIGPDYIELAFKKARETANHLGLDVVLYYNDYNDDQQNKAQSIYHMIKDINERYQEENPGELLIQGMGMQSHYNMNTNPTNVRLSMERFIELGVEIGVTELDVTAGSGGVQTAKEANRQAYIYAELFSLYKEHAEHISRVTIWGLNDATSWRAEQSPLVFDANLQSKLAYEAIMDPETFLLNYEEEQVPVREGQAIKTETTPILDGVEDGLYKEAMTLSVDRFQQAWSTATAEAKAVWDDDFLYVLVNVTNDVLDVTSANAWEQDSVEVFVDQLNSKAPNYDAAEGIGQYRVNVENVQSFGNGNVYEGFKSATKVNGTSYTVEMAIPLTNITPSNETVIGFDLQINDGEDGTRVGVATWNDTSGQGFQDPSVFGEVTLVSDDTDETPTPGEPGEETPTPGEPEEETPTPGDENSTNNDTVIGLSKAPVRVSKGETIVIEDLKATIKMPNDLPEGTTITVGTYDEETYTAANGEKLNVRGEIITVNLVFPEGFEGYEGEFKLTLGVNADADNPAVYYLGEDGWELRGGDYDEENGVIRLMVSGFSTYGVFETEVDDAAGETLPDTSTMMFNWSVIGAILLLVSAGLFRVNKRKQTVKY